MNERDGLGLFWDESEGGWTVYASFEDWDDGYRFDESFAVLSEAAAHLLEARIEREKFLLAREARALATERAELEAVELQMLLARTQRSELKQIKAQFNDALSDLRDVLKSGLSPATSDV